MCIEIGHHRSREDAERLLAEIIARELGVRFESEKLGALIRNRWGAISALAHEIHAPLPRSAATPMKV